MANLTVTITTPSLTSGQSFKERHRLLPAGPWSSYATRTNAPFTVTGLAEGDYQFEFILVKADATECAAAYYTYTVTGAEDFECIDFAVSQMREPDKLKIEYTVPVGYVAAGCGYTVGCRLPGGTAYTITSYAALPASPFYIPLPFTGKDVEVRIDADLCEASKICFEDIVDKPVIPPCNRMTNADTIPVQPVFLDFVPGTGYARFRIRLPFVQSDPPCLNVSVIITQTNVRAGYTPAVHTTPSVVITASATYIDCIMEFNPASAKNKHAEWEASITDCCGKSMYYNGSIQLP